ncbi:hypothetical protein ACFYY8_21265 [Streptosporangium sp. NPDC001559]|uniref:hypothetical protein n=1 Tax=Streptosporangium sp. NPDC001559 TaxID=3366187 RepID=UPI0036E2480B
MTFIDDVLAGRASINDFDDYIDTWHSQPEGKPLHVAAGLLWPEYAMWVNDADTMTYIVEGRKVGKNLLEYLLEQKDHDPKALKLWGLADRLYAAEWRNPDRYPEPK